MKQNQEAEDSIHSKYKHKKQILEQSKYFVEKLLQINIF